jgi:phage-related protein
MKADQQRWEVVYYETPSGRRPVADFLGKKGLTYRQRANALEVLAMLEEAGYSLGPPWLKKLESDLWELRKEVEGVWLRFIFCQEGTRFVILHALKKKSNRLPQKDLQLARDRRHEYRK